MTIVSEPSLSNEEIQLLLLQSNPTPSYDNHNDLSHPNLDHHPLNKETNEYVNLLYKAEFIPFILQLCKPYSTLFNVTLNDPFSLERCIHEIQIQVPLTCRLYLSIACLLLYIQLNYTGPTLPKEQWNSLPLFFTSSSSSMQTNTQSFILNLLSLDGELPFQLVQHPILLYTALTLFDSLTPHFPSSYWWKARSLKLQSDLFDFPGANLHDQWIQSMQQVPFSSFSSSSLSMDSDSNSDLSTFLLSLWHLEFAVGYQVWKEDSLALHHLQQAQDCIHFEFQVEGKLGKRTKFQEHSHSQLVLLARSSTTPSFSEALTRSLLKPSDCLLNDDVLLEHIAFDDLQVEEKELIFGALSPIEQCILLGHCQHIQNTHPNQDVIAMEQMQAYVRRILDQQCHHPTLSFSTLHFRSKLETYRSRTQERAVLQLQTLTDYIHQSTTPFPLPLYFFATASVPTLWQLQLELAECYMKLGAMKSALQLYEQYQVWESMVTCCILLEKKDKAEQLVLTLLRKEPQSPRYLCLLGDLRKDPTLYEQAWEVSKHTLARPKRSLGYYYFKLRNYQASLQAWQEALKLNPMFQEGWFIAGCAALQLSDWTSAIELFSRSTAMNPEQGHAWSNLATSYLQLNKISEAFHAYKQAVRCNPQDWKVWDNFLPVALKLMKWEDALLAFRALLQHAPLASSSSSSLSSSTYVFPMALFQQFTQQIPYDQLTVNQQERLHALFQQIQSKAQSWTVFHSLALAYEHLHQTHHLLSCCEQGFRWLGQPLDVQLVHSACFFLWSKYQTYGPTLNDQGEPLCPDWAYQAKLAVASLIAKLKNDHEHTPQFQDLCKLLNEIETTINMQSEE